MPYRVSIAVFAALPSSAAAGVQSVLDPKGLHADRVADMGWVMFAGAALIFIGVLAVLAVALYQPPGWRGRLGSRGFVVAAGIGLPIVVLSALLFYAFGTAAQLSRAGMPPAVRIEVSAEMWWWRVRYLDSEDGVLFETANDIRIPAGQPVEFVLKSDNVIHSFWVPNLAGKVDMVPGHVNRLRAQAHEPGRFRGQCAEYCGAQHAKMMFEVQAMAAADFQAWTAAQRLPAREPGDARLLAGKRYFMRACAQCHTIRGTAAAGVQGPDLTHVGSRSSLAAGVLDNNIGSLAGWIAGSQHIKPGNAMPSFNQLSGEGLRAIAQYMESLQ